MGAQKRGAYAPEGKRFAMGEWSVSVRRRNGAVDLTTFRSEEAATAYFEAYSPIKPAGSYPVTPTDVMDIEMIGPDGVATRTCKTIIGRQVSRDEFDRIAAGDSDSTT